MFAIETINLEKHTNGFLAKEPRTALRPLTLNIKRAKSSVFLGPKNGAGKTTTLKLLMGLVFPTGGIGTDPA